MGMKFMEMGGDGMGLQPVGMGLKLMGMGWGRGNFRGDVADVHYRVTLL